MPNGLIDGRQNFNLLILVYKNMIYNKHDEHDE